MGPVFCLKKPTRLLSAELSADGDPAAGEQRWIWILPHYFTPPFRERLLFHYRLSISMATTTNKASSRAALFPRATESQKRKKEKRTSWQCCTPTHPISLTKRRHSAQKQQENGRSFVNWHRSSIWACMFKKNIALSVSELSRSQIGNLWRTMGRLVNRTLHP